MFCGKCGKQIPDGLTDCPECSAVPVQEVSTQTDAADSAEQAVVTEAVAQEAVAEKKPVNKKLIKLILIAACAVAVLGIVAVVLFMTVFNKLDITEYIKLKGAEGLDGYGTATYTVDFSGIAEELEFEELRDIKKFEKYIKNGDVAMPQDSDDVEAIANTFDLDLDEMEDFFDAVTFTVENDGALKNGDTVKLIVDVDKDIDDFKKGLVGGELTASVKGLEEATVLDLFEMLSVSFSGENGKGALNSSENQEQDWHYYVDYEFDKTESLTNGDVVTVTATINDYEYIYEQELSKGNYLTETATKTYTVSGLFTYLTKDKVTDTIMTEAVNTAVSATGNDAFADSTVLIYYVDNTDSDEDFGYYDVHNALVVALFCEIDDNTYNYVVGYEDCIINEDGSISLGESNSILSGRNYDEEGVKTYIDYEYYSGYEITKIK